MTDPPRAAPTRAPSLAVRSREPAGHRARCRYELHVWIRRWDQPHWPRGGTHTHPRKIGQNIHRVREGGHTQHTLTHEAHGWGTRTAGRATPRPPNGSDRGPHPLTPRGRHSHPRKKPRPRFRRSNRAVLLERVASWGEQHCARTALRQAGRGASSGRALAVSEVTDSRGGLMASSSSCTRASDEPTLSARAQV